MASATGTKPGTRTTVEMGRVGVARSPELLTAILGSCVGVTLYHPRFRIGAMAHVVLPKATGGNPLPGKFADTAVPYMIDQIEKAGGSGTGLVAKLAGGSCMFGKAGPLQIGQTNAEAIREALDRSGVRITGTDIGGSQGRRVVFDTASGELTIEIVGSPPRVI